MIGIPISEFSDNDNNDDNSFCIFLSDADENNTDDIRFVRNEVPKKPTFETYQKLWMNKTTILLFHKKEKFIKLILEKTKSLEGQQKNQMFPASEMSPTLLTINFDCQDVQTI